MKQFLPLAYPPFSNLVAASVSVDPPSNTILLYVNGRRHQLPSPPPSLLLVSFLRDTLRLTGTKIGCGEGGCGACTVILGSYDKATQKVSFRAINSCLRPLCAMDGQAVWTVEGMRSENGGETGEDEGVHPIQTQLVASGGTQCGFCTPGWCVNMYGLLLEKQQQQQEEGEKGGVGGMRLAECEVERHFDGNLCRCTGYRPILEAFKSFASAGVEVEEGGAEGGKEEDSVRGVEESEEEEGEWVKVCAGGAGCPHAGDRMGKGDIEDMCSAISSSPFFPFLPLHLLPQATPAE